jgi:3-oxoacyl-[acyl-carrier protein] reductase
LTREKEIGQTLDRDGKAIAIGLSAAMRRTMPMLIPLGRAGTPRETAGPLLFVASSLSDYVSGQGIEVRGGF